MFFSREITSFAKLPAMNNFQQFFRKNSDIEVFLVTKKENIFYLTGFRGSFGYLLVLKTGESFLITDSRYAEVAKNLAKKSDFEFFLFDKDFKAKIRELLNKPPSRSPLSSGEFTVAMENSAKLAEKEFWQEIFPSAKIISQGKIIEKWRAIKNASELQKVRQACNRVNEVFDDVDFFRGILREGVTEKEVSFELEIKLRENGKYELSFPIIVAFGENSALPHHNPGNRRLKSRENILIDCGVKFENYCSDITRNFFLGKPEEDYYKCFVKLLDVQKKTVKKFQIGQKLLDTNKFCRQKLENFAEFFTHSLGHGVGLEVHELPSFSKTEQAVFQVGQVITCEPGLYFPRKFGIRIEDQILITDNGPEILTKTSKELIVL